jgi:hypothetical protein
MDSNHDKVIQSVAGYLERGSPISSAGGNKKPLIRAFALTAISKFP